jgi:hypothetical protein
MNPGADTVGGDSDYGWNHDMTNIPPSLFFLWVSNDKIGEAREFVFPA